MIVLDIEATGTDYERHSILSIGALDLEDPTNQFYDECRVWDGAHISEEALAINGMTEVEARDSNKKSESELIAAFVAWACDRPVDRTFAGQNPSFDRDYVKAACHRAHIDYPFAHRTIDAHTLCYMHMVKRGLIPQIENHRSVLNLDAVLNYCGIPEEPRPHNALTGAFSHAEVIARLLYDKKLLKEFSEYEI